jgi:hypothetical protein
LSHYEAPAHPQNNGQTRGAQNRRACISYCGIHIWVHIDLDAREPPEAASAVAALEA